MDTGGLIWTYFFLISVCTCTVSGSPIATTVINCDGGGNEVIGPVDEGFSGDVELVTGITAGSNVKLVPYLFPAHLGFLELNFTVGETTATVRTKKPLDADAPAATGSSLYYSIMCDGEIKLDNTRNLKITDFNDNGPVFVQKHYSKTVSEAEPVGTEVLRVKAVDADSTPANYVVTYSVEPTSEDFMMTGSGAFIVQRRLNYNVVQSYSFTVTAKDSGGRNDTATVQINVEDFDNLNPYFLHNLYQAFIPEEQTGVFSTIQPGAIKALDGDTGINMTLIYSISSVTPEKYLANFNIDSISGVVSVVTAIDREEMNNSTISVNIKAAQSDDPLKTADAVVSVTVEDINDNAPQFEKSEYSETVLENSPVGTVVLNVTVTDLDQGGFVGTLQIVPESAPFSISSDGIVIVKNSSVLDRETTESFTFQEPTSEDFMMTSSGAFILKRRLNYTLVQSYSFTVKAQDSGGLSDTATVQINVQDVDNLNPYFLHNLYQAFIPEEQVGFFRTIQPEAIKALDGDTGINMTLTYSISSVTPEKYRANFNIDSISGVVSVVTAIDREEMNSSTIYVNIKAAQSDDPLKTADAVVSVTVEDINDNAPMFEKSEYSETVLENSPVGTVVLNVTVTDLDQGGFVGTLQIVPQSAPFSISSDGTVIVKNSTALDRETTESFTFQETTSEDFMMTSSGALILKRRLNYTLVQSYSFTVKAQDSGGLSDTATVQINVQDVDNLNPYFLHNLYQAFIPEEQVGFFSSIQPEAIKALPGDIGINATLTYSISSVTPEKYCPNFNIDSISGVVSVVTAIDREEMNSSTISVNIKAAQSDDPLKTAGAVVSVTVEDINDNAPVFEKSEYSETVLENSPVGAVVLNVTVIDLDQGGFVGTLQIVPESAPFSISSDGTVTVKDSSVLDRETTESFTFQVVAVDQVTDSLTATAQVSITILDVNDKAPQFPDIPDPLHISEEVYSEVVWGEMSLSIGTVRVQVEDVNEAPQFPPEVYKASVFSTDPNKTPVILVKASDPDVGDEGQLEYSLVSGSPYFDVDTSSGLVFVVSVVDLSGQAAAVEVKVTDPKGLKATAKVEVDILGSTSRNDVVTISLNRPANIVEGNIPEMEKSLGKALGWTVNVIEVSNSTRGSPKSRTLREAAKSLVNFIAVYKAEVVSYEEVVKKLQSESAAVTAELTKVFGEDVQFAVQEKPKSSDNLALIISLSVIVPVVLVVLIIVLARTGSFRRWVHFSKKAEDQAMNMDNMKQDRQSNR